MATPTDPARKPGWQTSEFYITIATQIIGILVAVGVLTADQAGLIQTQASQIITQSFALIAVAGPAIAYIWSRAKVKTKGQ